MERIQRYIMSSIINSEMMLELENKLSSFLNKNNISLVKIPVDIFEVALLLGFDVRGAKFDDDRDGLILVNEKVEKINTFNSNKIIAYNCNRDINEIKFIVGHELAHFIQEKEAASGESLLLAARDHRGDYSQNLNEQQNDYIAAALLIPKQDLLSRYSKDDIAKTEDFYSEVARIYNVNPKMAERRIQEVFYGKI